MKKICLSVVGLFLLFVSGFSQGNPDTSTYKSKKLKLDEVNLVSGYYHQDGNHSAVTGGIGTQKLSDVSNIIELKFINWGGANGNNKYTLETAVGIDYHTSASQAFVSQTGASKPNGTRFYPSVNWKVEQANKLTIGGGLSYSSEFNYHSIGLNFLAGKISRDENTEVTFKAQAFLDRVTLIEPSEFAPKPSDGNVSTYTTASGNVITSYSRASSSNIPTSPRNTFSGSLTLSHVLNKNFQLAVIADAVAQQGYLGLPFHRVYFKDGGTNLEKIENLPGSRFKLPIGIRANWFATDKLIFRTYYRYYTDNWGIRSHTASIELPYKLSPFVSVAPFYRYYTQTAAYYFAPYQEHLSTDTYYTSNYDLSAFKSHYAGLNFRFTPEKGIFIFDMIELRYGHYFQTTGLHGDNVGLNIRFK
jgi:hypothetical protein